MLLAEVLLLRDAVYADPAPLLLLGLVCTVALNSGARPALVLTLASNAVVIGGELLCDCGSPLLWIVGQWMTFLAGWALHSQERTMLELEQAQEQLAERAATEERRRVAREVHDVVAHTLAVTMLHLTGARLALAEGDTPEAEAGLREAERLGRESLVGLRRTVGLLTREEERTAAPAPGLSCLDALADEYAAGGADVRLTTSVAREVPDDVGLAAYRIVQESLANAVRHAPGAAVDVRVADDRRALTVEVTDTGGTAPAGPATGGGQGLAGMAERAALLGGTCRAGRLADGRGWRVTAVLPLEATAAAPVQRAAEQPA